MHETLTTLGQVRCRVAQLSHTPPTAVVVLCHGYGAPGNDLVPLAAEIAHVLPGVADRIRFVFPEAPLSLAALGAPGANAWWHLDIQTLMNPQRRSAALEDMRRHSPEGLPQARRLLRGAIEALMQATELPYGKLVLGGFSQGAMLATDIALRLDEAPGALAILSGTLIEEDAWRKRAPMRRGLPVLQTHGTEDPILPYANALPLRDLLVEGGLEVDFVTFRGGHTIPGEALTRLAALVQRVAAA